MRWLLQVSAWRPWCTANGASVSPPPPPPFCSPLLLMCFRCDAVSWAIVVFGVPCRTRHFCRFSGKRAAALLFSLYFLFILLMVLGYTKDIDISSLGGAIGCAKLR